MMFKACPPGDYTLAYTLVNSSTTAYLDVRVELLTSTVYTFSIVSAASSSQQGAQQFASDVLANSTLAASVAQTYLPELNVSMDAVRDLVLLEAQAEPNGTATGTAVVYPILLSFNVTTGSSAPVQLTPEAAAALASTQTAASSSRRLLGSPEVAALRYDDMMPVHSVHDSGGEGGRDGGHHRRLHRHHPHLRLLLNAGIDVPAHPSSTALRLLMEDRLEHVGHLLRLLDSRAPAAPYAYDQPQRGLLQVWHADRLLTPQAGRAHLGFGLCTAFKFSSAALMSLHVDVDLDLHHHQKAFRNKSHTSHGQRPGLKRNKSKGKRITTHLIN